MCDPGLWNVFSKSIRLFLRSPYIPVQMDPALHKFEADAFGNTLLLYNKLILNARNEAKHANKKPLILINHIGFNNYVAWSLDEKKEVYVMGYKSFRDTFAIIGSTDDITKSSITKNHDYMVFTPDEDIMYATGLDLNLFKNIWDHIMPFDNWEERPVRVADEDIIKAIEDKNVKGIYLRSIDLINNSRGFDLGNDDLIANLETRVERFEKIMKTSPLPVLIEEEVKLLSSSIENIEKNIKSFRFTL